MASPEQGIRALHTWTAGLSSRNVRSIMQAALYVADTVLLPATAIIAGEEDASARQFAVEQLHRLRDLRAIEFWQVEEIKPTGIVIPNVPTVFLTSQQYGAIYHQALDRLMDERRLFLGSGATNFCGVTEIVVGKQALIHSALAETLHAHTVLHNNDSARGYGQYLASLLDPLGLVSEIAEAVAVELDLPEASSLPDHILERCRAHLAPFRQSIITRLQAHSPVLLGQQDLTALKDVIVREIVMQYNEYLESARPSRRHDSRLAKAVWRIKRINPKNRSRAADEPMRHPLQMLIELQRAGQNQ